MPDIAPYLTVFIGVFSAFIALWVAYLRGRQSHKTELLKLSISTAHLDFNASADGSTNVASIMSQQIGFFYIFFSELDKTGDPTRALQTTMIEMSRFIPEYDNYPIYNTDPEFKKFLNNFQGKKAEAIDTSKSKSFKSNRPESR